MSKKHKHCNVSESDDAPPVEADFIYDTTEELVGRKLKEGLNCIKQGESGLELIIKATPGEAIEYIVLNSDGEEIDEAMEIKVFNKKKKKTTCWECGKDGGGNTHCWKIPCPVIVGPWKPGKVLAMGLRFE